MSTTSKKEESFSHSPHITTQPIVEEVEQSYLDYAMSVIVSRALPDVRDGLKPVHRRVLYAMWNLGLKANGKFRKSAMVVGEVLGKYHPHGDVAVYDSLVRMAQDFSLRMPLINGQGNFGSMDNDSAAAMRYTEVKLQKIAEEMLYDLDKETVPFVANYDGTQKEPSVLPAKIPNLLLNGTLGIAVGMATNIPPHNLGELCEGMVHIIENPKATAEDLTQCIKGPDFPTGGIVYNKQDIAQAYATGRGGVVVRAKTEIVEQKNGTFAILVTEIPFQLNKASLIEKIAELVRDKKIEDIKDLRDESNNKEGVRIVIELKKDAYPKKVLNRLFKLTPLQSTFHYNMVALVDGIQPRVLNLKMILEECIRHRQEVIRKRTAFDLAKARARAHILEGLSKAMENINAIIALIKKSKDKEMAKFALIKEYRFTEIQAQAILDMRLHQLAHLERQQIEDELKEKRVLIKELESILSSPKKILEIIKKETLELRASFADERRTAVVAHGVKEFATEDLIPDESTIVVITRDGYIKRLPPDTFKTQARGGKGVIGLTTKKEDVVQNLFSTTSHADLLFFTNRGRVFQLKAYDVPQASRTAKGQALVNFLQLGSGEQVTTTLSVRDLAHYKFLLMVTIRGTAKKIPIESLKQVRRSGLIAIRLHSGDALQWTRPTTGADEVIISSRNGQAIRFKEKDIRVMGRNAAGIRGIRLKGSDEVVGMDVITSEKDREKKFELFVVTEQGLGKKTPVKEYKVQRRGGSGIKTLLLTAKTGKLVYAEVISPHEEHDVLLISQKGQLIRVPLATVPTLGRATQGVRLMRFKELQDRTASVTLF